MVLPSAIADTQVAEYEYVISTEWLQEHFTCLKSFENFKNTLISILTESRCVLKGHFELLSGRHTQYFMRFSSIGRRTKFYRPIAQKLCEVIRSRFPEIDAVLCPDTAGSALAYEIQREYSEKDIPMFVSKTDELRQPTDEINFVDVKPGTRVLIVNDSVTTGHCVRSLIKIARDKGCEVIGIVLFATKGCIEEIDGVPIVSMCKMDWKDHEWTETNCPLKSAITLERFLN